MNNFISYSNKNYYVDGLYLELKSILDYTYHKSEVVIKKNIFNQYQHDYIFDSEDNLYKFTLLQNKVFCFRNNVNIDDEYYNNIENDTKHIDIEHINMISNLIIKEINRYYLLLHELIKSMNICEVNKNINEQNNFVEFVDLYTLKNYIKYLINIYNTKRLYFKNGITSYFVCNQEYFDDNLISTSINYTELKDIINDLVSKYYIIKNINNNFNYNLLYENYTDENLKDYYEKNNLEKLIEETINNL